ncbi:DinB family protein [Paenibacillus nanensis]|uniref:DinB family protein n=1 Tax=Paenibacillus nanensis TaxID=393251 RepID=A0A3A1UVC7_9BACL|nr:DinB family protein [Paenibacillus nanensis]RIX52155.1 DinB family protein [Paenibacillus nanensis]
MGNYLFKQLRFVRTNTVQRVKDMSMEKACIVPRGFNNNVLWNLGHILFVHERFSFALINEKMELPNHFAELFAPGTKPENGGTPLPELDEIIFLLSNQMDRIEQSLENRLEEQLEKPYVTSTGLEISTIKECLSFCLYHEGMHFAAIKSIKQQLGKEEIV